MSSKEDINPESLVVTNSMDPRAATLDDDENNPESLVVTNSMDPPNVAVNDNIIEPKFTIPQLKKIFVKQQAIDVLKLFNPELFGIRTSRSRNITYLGEDLYTDIQKIDTKKLMNYTRDFSISNEDGKYKDINDDPEYYKRLIALTNVRKEDSPCHPQQFSESVVKPNMRRAIKDKSDDIVAAVIAMTSDKYINHVKERINQQAKADYSEWLILNYNPNIMPTLKHCGGTDMYLITATAIVDLDIKTTRSIWGITDPKEAITKLYENQGEDRFSSHPRLYIYLSDNDEIDEQQLRLQLETTYDIIFQYNNVTYTVIGARLIII
tara:strand:+ start:117 stop:1085 length:969 start_codon:yes stop_codon:yes gene_type:complete